MGRFNSRTPGGVRLYLLPSFHILSAFQFTHPGRGATSTNVSGVSSIVSFNSRTPGGVRLIRVLRRILTGLSFNSRTPGGVRLWGLVVVIL